MKQYAANARVWLIGGAVTGVLILAISWLLVISPERSSTGDLRAQAAETEQQNDLLRVKVATLKAKSANKEAYAASLRQAQAALPNDSGLPAFTRQLNAQARAAGVSLSGLVVGQVTAVSPTAATSTTPSTTSSPSPSSAGGLYSVQVVATSTGSLSNQLAFLRAIREGSRRALVTSTQISAAGESKTGSVDDSSTFTTNLTVFSAPQSPQQVRQVRQLLVKLHG